MNVNDITTNLLKSANDAADLSTVATAIGYFNSIVTNGNRNVSIDLANKITETMLNYDAHLCEAAMALCSNLLMLARASDNPAASIMAFQVMMAQMLENAST